MTSCMEAPGRLKAPEVTSGLWQLELVADTRRFVSLLCPTNTLGTSTMVDIRSSMWKKVMLFGADYRWKVEPDI